MLRPIGMNSAQLMHWRARLIKEYDRMDNPDVLEKDYRFKRLWDPPTARSEQAHRNKVRLNVLRHAAGVGVQSELHLADALTKLFQRLDVNKDGHLSSHEIFEGMRGMGFDVSEDSIRSVMRWVDKDGNGNINLQEFLEAFCKNERSNNALRDYQTEDVAASGKVTRAVRHFQRALLSVIRERCAERGGSVRSVLWNTLLRQDRDDSGYLDQDEFFNGVRRELNVILMPREAAEVFAWARGSHPTHVEYEVFVRRMTALANERSRLRAERSGKSMRFTATASSFLDVADLPAAGMPSAPCHQVVDTSVPSAKATLDAQRRVLVGGKLVVKKVVKRHPHLHKTGHHARHKHHKESRRSRPQSAPVVRHAHHQHQSHHHHHHDEADHHHHHHHHGDAEPQAEPSPLASVTADPRSRFGWQQRTVAKMAKPMTHRVVDAQERIADLRARDAKKRALQSPARGAAAVFEKQKLERERENARRIRDERRQQSLAKERSEKAKQQMRARLSVSTARSSARPSTAAPARPWRGKTDKDLEKEAAELRRAVQEKTQKLEALNSPLRARPATASSRSRSRQGARPSTAGASRRQ